MKFKNIMGGINVNQWTIFDNHLFLLLFPIVIIFIFLTFKVWFWNNKTKVIAVNGIASVLLLAIFVSLFEKWIDSTMDEAVSGLGGFDSLDSIVTMAFAVSLLARRYELSRTLIPGVIVLGLMRLINNPGVFIGYIDIAISVSSISVAAIMLIVFKKLISLQSHIIMVLLTVIVLGYSFATNKITAPDYSMMTLNSIINNPVYKWIPLHGLIIASFIVAVVFFETVIWFVVRVIYHNHASKRESVTLFSSLRKEVYNLNHEINRKLTKTEVIHKIGLEIFQMEEISAINDENEIEEVDFVFENEIPVHPIEYIIQSIQIFRTKASFGTRAPSFN